MPDDDPPVLAATPDRPRTLVYLGTPDVAVAPLVALHEAGFAVPLVVTRPDRRRGRGGGVAPSPVKVAAQALGLRVEHDLASVCEVGAELGVVVAYGRIIPRLVLERMPMVNLHFSLLPRWRGAAPVERALLAGDPCTGVCLMEVAEGLDTGGVYARAETDIRDDDTLASLRDRLVDLGTDLLVRRLTDGLGGAEPQSGDVTHAAKMDPSEYAIDWTATAARIDRLVRLGGAYTTWKGKRLKVWSARPVDAGRLAEVSETEHAADEPWPGVVIGGTRSNAAGLYVGAGDGAVEVLEVQPEGKSRQPLGDWRNGAQPALGDRFVT